MFTGIIQQLGHLTERKDAAGGARLYVRPESPLVDLETGESIANEGVCLTVEPSSRPDRLEYYMSRETLERTTLGGLRAGAALNMERSLGLGAKMGGHFVMGHVDGVGEITRLDRDGEGWNLEIAFPPAMRRYLAPKGSIAVDGISLTVVGICEGRFSVAVIPHTREVTSLREKSAGSPVNLEADMIARYVAEQFANQAEARLPGVGGGLTEISLRDAGFS